MSKRGEISSAAVVGGIAGVYLSAAADAGGLLIFAAAVLGAAVLAALALLGIRALERRRKSREHITNKTTLLTDFADRLVELEKRQATDVGALRTMHPTTACTKARR